MPAPTLSLQHSPPETPTVADVLSEIRSLNAQRPHAAYLETRELQRTLRRHGFYADLATVESARGWLLADNLEIVI